MASTPLLRLGTRRSPLAMAQAEEARARLCAAHDWPESAVELVTVIASGDRIQDRPLADIGGKALWTRELDQWLAEGGGTLRVADIPFKETRDYVGRVLSARANYRRTYARELAL